MKLGHLVLHNGKASIPRKRSFCHAVSRTSLRSPADGEARGGAHQSGLRWAGLRLYLSDELELTYSPRSGIFYAVVVDMLPASPEIALGIFWMAVLNVGCAPAAPLDEVDARSIEIDTPRVQPFLRAPEIHRTIGQ